MLYTYEVTKFLLQYLEEIIGSILFCWIACGVSLAALVEVIAVSSYCRVGRIDDLIR